MLSCSFQVLDFISAVVPVLCLKKKDLIRLPDIYVSSRQPLQAGHIQGRELVPSQTQPLYVLELFQDGGDRAEAVEG